MKEKPTLVVTLSIDTQSQDLFNGLRLLHFPAHINYLKAHITLFHHLPAGNDRVAAIISKYNNQEQFPIMVKLIACTGNGNAYVLESETLQHMHEAMQQEMGQWLISKDKQILKPHITIQNKVTAYKALLLNKHLSEDFSPFEITATGLSAWLYKNGPWELLETISFK